MCTSTRFIFVLFLVYSNSASALYNCKDLFSANRHSSPEYKHDFVQQFSRPQDLTAWLSEQEIPYFLKQTPNGEKPVILVNKKTIHKLRPLLDNTFGVQVLLRPGGRSDHGLLRLGDTQMDRSTPGGIRDFGEINKNGFSWRSMSERIIRRDDQSFTIMESFFLISKEEYESILFYQTIRRGSFFEVPFTFGTVPEMNGATALKVSGEHCFTFCKGNMVAEQINSLNKEIKQKAPHLDVENILKSEEFLFFTKKLHDYFSKIDLNSAAELNYSAISSVQGYAELLRAGSLEDSPQSKVILSWLVSIHASTEYQKMIQQIPLDSSLGINEYAEARSMGVFVYSEQELIEAQVKDGSFTHSGVSYNWSNEGQRPAPSALRDVTKFDYKIWGDGTAGRESVVLIHGLGGSKETWDRVATELAKKYHVVAYDQRGHGATPYTGKIFDSKTMADDLKYLMSVLGIKKAHIVGHSMGGRTAMRFAELYPEHTLSVVVEDMHMKGRKSQPLTVNQRYVEMIQALPDTLSTLQLTQFLMQAMNISAESATFEVRYFSDQGLIRAEAEDGTINIAEVKKHLLAVEHYRVTALNEDLTEVLLSAPVSTLFLAADPYLRPVLFGVGVEHIRQNRSDIQVKVITGSGHGIHYDRFQEFILTLENFWNARMNP